MVATCCIIDLIILHSLVALWSLDRACPLWSLTPAASPFRIAQAVELLPGRHFLVLKISLPFPQLRIQVEEGSQLIRLLSHTSSIPMAQLAAAQVGSCGYIDNIWPQGGDDVVTKAPAALLEDRKPELQLRTLKI